MSSFTHNLNIGAGTWHSKWYHSWLERTERTQGTENLCHYVRVVLIWAPLAWFIKGRVFKVVAPWALALGLVLAVAFAGVFYLWPNDVLEVLAVMASVVVVVAIGCGALWIVEEGPDWALTTLLCVTFPIWIVPFLIIWPIIWLTDKYNEPIKAFKRWWTQPRFALGGMTPLIVLVLSLIVIGLGTLAVLNTKAFLTLLLYAAIIVGAGVVVGLVLGVMTLLFDGLKERHRTGKPVLGKKIQAFGETVSLGATYVASKKRGSRICPFIQFEETDAVDLRK